MLPAHAMSQPEEAGVWVVEMELPQKHSVGEDGLVGGGYWKREGGRIRKGEIEDVMCTKLGIRGRHTDDSDMRRWGTADMVHDKNTIGNPGWNQS